MPLQIPSRADVVSSFQTYVRTYLPELDPTVTRRRGWIGGMVRSLGSALHDWYVKLKRYGDREPFPQSASGDFLLNGWWRDITKLDPLPASPSTGYLVITGTNGAIVDAGAVISSGSHNYTIDNTAAVITQSLIITSLTRSGTTAIAETASEHFLATGQSVTISGASQSQYNVTAQILVTAVNEFTYQIVGTPVTPATGSPILTGTWGVVSVTCVDNGQDTNVDAGGSLTLSAPPVGVDSSAIVTFGGIAGGTDVETIESYRARILEALGTDFGMFSAAEIRIVAKQIAGVTRVWVIEATTDGANGVLPGQVKIYFMRDFDADPFPSSTEVATVRDHIISSIMPSHTDQEDVTVDKPMALSVDFSFSSITPDTAYMRRAIKASLEQFFSESVDLGVSVTADEYRCAIKATYDPERQEHLRAFTLSSPTGTVAIAGDELPVLGTISF